MRRQRSFWRRFLLFLFFKGAGGWGGCCVSPLFRPFSRFSAVLTTGRAPPGTSASPFFLLFSGADSWGRTVGHLCFPSFLVFQWCWQLGAHRRAPLLSFFSRFSAVLATGGAPPGTSVFLLFSPFSGTGNWKRTAGHLCFTLFPTFQRCPPSPLRFG